ncbi:ataxin-7-like protein 3 isoform X2 [Octopus bimaculoides]|uniref:ataxin-7-like protein 3 isoform X2 n=1 Tax=Octopus bimaculoides TaxID=37653 RepID=UPI0022E14F05|nr:ataxin-7-like protein 3 isoform X2 [Octopus bimaculoides]
MQKKRWVYSLTCWSPHNTELDLQMNYNLTTAVGDVTADLIDEVTLGVCFEVHRSAKIGTLFLGDTDPWSHKEHEIVYKSGVDVFGQVPTKKQFECTCPNCQRHLAASRFAPHLEKCMGMGRNSSRIASKRIATTTLKRDSDESLDDDNDNDWTYPDKKRKKNKKEKSSTNNGPTRKAKTNKTKNGEASPDSVTNYENMSLDERRNLLTSCCGVISEHTKKMCTRSFRCPQHNDEQRCSVRQFLLNDDHTAEHDHPDADDVQVDIDGYEDGDGQSLRDTLHWEASCSTSPVDSTSSSSRKRGPAKPLKPPVTKKKKIVKQTAATAAATAASASSSSSAAASSQSSSHPSNNPVNTSLYDFV